jgi:hypothetical protein
MSGRNLARVLGVMFVLVLACGSLPAQQSSHQIYEVPLSSVTIPAQPLPPVPATIFTNLGTPANTNLYYSARGWILSGPTNTTYVGNAYSLAVPFIPKSNSHVQLLEAAIGSTSGTNSILLGLQLDAGTNGAGVISSPNGTYIAGAFTTITNIMPFGTCCASTVTAHFSGAGTAVTAGAVYWVVAEASPAGSTFAGAWSFSVDALGSSELNGGGFGNGAGLGAPALLVKGTTP